MTRGADCFGLEHTRLQYCYTRNIIQNKKDTLFFNSVSLFIYANLQQVNHLSKFNAETAVGASRCTRGFLYEVRRNLR